jgi:hypothetical protein
MKIYIDGKYFSEREAKISVFDHGLLYGDGIFEGIRAYNGRVFKLKEHIDRLFFSAKAILLNIPMSHAEIMRAVVETCRRVLGVDFGATTGDGMFTLREVECLGACVNAPMMQIGDDYYEDLDSASTEAILRTLKTGGTPKPGPQSSRKTCEPQGGLTTLTDRYGDGAKAKPDGASGGT